LALAVKGSARRCSSDLAANLLRRQDLASAVLGARLPDALFLLGGDGLIVRRGVVEQVDQRIAPVPALDRRAGS
jgi:hypothetical protein